MTLKRDYYTIEETADLIDNYSLDDLYHFIETKQIKPALYTPKRRFIAITWDQKNKQFIACATCLYQGLLQTHQNVIDSLLEKGKITLRTVSKPLSPQNISLWDSRYPYTNKEPDLVFSTWHPHPSLSNSTPKKNLYLVPFPIERESILSSFKKLMDNFEKAKHIPPNSLEKHSQIEVNELPEKKRYAYDFHENGVFTMDSLRLTLEDITTLTSNHKTTYKPVKDTSEDSLPWSTSKKGGDLINEKIEHIYRQHHTEFTTQLWRKMETLYNENHFDSVIDRVTSDEISWVSRKKVEKTTSYNSFEKKVSQIRVFYRENKIRIHE